MNELLKYKKQYDELDYKCNLSGKEALKAVKQNSWALQYVNKKFFEEADKPYCNCPYRRV